MRALDMNTAAGSRCSSSGNHDAELAWPALHEDDEDADGR